MKTKKLFLAAALLILLLTTPRAQSGSVQFYGPLSRVITPNSGGPNSTILFCFDNPTDAGIIGTIYDMRGARVAGMSANQPASPASASGCPQQGFLPQYVSWNGHAFNGSVVNSGVYIYEITVSGNTYSGTIVVVR